MTNCRRCGHAYADHYGVIIEDSGHASCAKCDCRSFDLNLKCSGDQNLKCSGDQCSCPRCLRRRELRRKIEESYVEAMNKIVHLGELLKELP
jgi:hypothetical protein